MADKKKLSVEEIMALARGNKAASGSASAETPAPKAAKPAADEPAAEAAPASPPAKVDPKKMSTADIMAMARGGGAKPAAAAAKPTTAEKPAASGDKPAAKMPAKGAGMSIADIMAAARGGGAPAKAEAKPAAPKPAAKAAAVAAVVEDEPTEKVVIRDNASVLGSAGLSGGAAAKKLGPVSKSAATGVVAAPAKPAKEKIAVPPMPTRPVLAGAGGAGAVAASDRRGFMTSVVAVIFGSSLAIGMASLASTFLVWTLGFARYMFPNVLVEPPTRFKAGFPDTLSPGQVETKYIPQFGVWVVKNEYEGKQIIYALKSVCTHLGCTPNWLEGEQKFKCPCHGSGFYKDGVNFEGPAPRPLERYAISLADDGQLLVDKSRVFNQELGQWTDPNSFVPV